MRGLLVFLACVPAFAVSSSRPADGATSLRQNGEKTESLPWHASIFIEQSEELVYKCGGSLVSPCVVLTAAHCVPDREIFVALGKHLKHWNSESGKHIHKTRAKNSTKHPYYRGYAAKLAFDIAILELEKCSPTNDKIATVRIDKNIQPVSSADIKVPSWGNGATASAELQSVTLAQLTQVDCVKVMSTNIPQLGYITHDKFCAKRRPGMSQSGLMHGDGGGAALVKKGGSWYMTGVVSSRVKDENGEDVFTLTKVSDYLDWIQEFHHNAGNSPSSCLPMEVRCGDGKCVAPSRRCDGRQDCSDGSDEDPGLCRKQASLVKAPSSSADRASPGSCGRAKAGPTSLVQNGEKTAIETVPWHAGIFIQRDGRLENVCGGSLVSPCVVVTAAHCVTGAKMYVALGKYLSGWDSESGKNVHKTQVKRMTKHRHYRGHPTKLAFDIAVLELEDCSPINGNIATVCMDKNIRPVSSADIKVAGWGNETTVLTELESVTLTQLNFDNCLDVMTNNGAHVAYITTDKFCATRHKGAPQSGLLTGDSGGAALVKQGGSWYFTGVVSSRVKDGKNQDVYVLTKVSDYVDWIRGFV